MLHGTRMLLAMTFRSSIMAHTCTGKPVSAPPQSNQRGGACADAGIWGACAGGWSDCTKLWWGSMGATPTCCPWRCTWRRAFPWCCMCATRHMPRWWSCLSSPAMPSSPLPLPMAPPVWPLPSRCALLPVHALIHSRLCPASGPPAAAGASLHAVTTKVASTAQAATCSLDLPCTVLSMHPAFRSAHTASPTDPPW